MILKGVIDFKTFVLQTIQHRSSMLSFFAFLHLHVCVKKILLTYQLDAKQFQLFLLDIEKKYLLALAVPGYPNGTNSSQVMAQGIIQGNFNAPKTKASSGNAVTNGIQRMNECTTASKKIKEPAMEIFLLPSHQTPEKIRKLAQQMKMVTLGSVIKNDHVLFDPLPQREKDKEEKVKFSFSTNSVETSTIPLDTDTQEKVWNKQYSEEDAFLLKVVNPFLTSSSISTKQYNNYSSYVIRFELHRDKLLRIGKNINDVVQTMQNELLYGKHHMWTYSPVFSSKWIIRIRLNCKAGEFSKRVKVKFTSRTEKETVQCLVDILLSKTIFNGLNNIKDVVVHEIEQVHWKEDTLEVYKQKEYYLVSDGTNFQNVLNLEGVDHKRTISNDIYEIN